MTRQQELAWLRHEAEAAFRRYPSVRGLSFGLKSVRGVTVDELALCVYVSEKKRRADLNRKEIIPMDFLGMPTDVIPVPTIVPQHCIDMQAHKIMIGGITISSFKKDAAGNPSAGTLGFFATIDGMGGPENVVLVSNHHVLMQNGAAEGDEIYQPEAREEAGVIKLVFDEKNSIGKIHNRGLETDLEYQYAGEQNKHFYFVDCATAKLDLSISTWCHTNCGTKFNNQIRKLKINERSSIASVGRVTDADVADPNRPYIVYKVGRQTGLTTGKVTLALAQGPGGTGLVMKIEPLTMDAACKDAPGDPNVFMKAGDSGSAVLNEQRQLVGLLFGVDHNDPKIAYACHIHPVLEALKVTPITDANPHSAASTLSDLPGVITDGEVNHALLLRQRFQNTEKGREILALVNEHRLEVAKLVNHKRPVTVSWHRSQGPLFLSHLMNNARDPAHVVPRELEGVNRETVIQNMAKALSAHGSSELKSVVEQNLEYALAYVNQFDDLHELVGQLDSLKWHE